MNHYSGFASHPLIKERNEEIRREVQALRFEGQLRKDRRQTLSRLVAFVLRSTLPLLHTVRLATH